MFARIRSALLLSSALVVTGCGALTAQPGGTPSAPDALPPDQLVFSVAAGGGFVAPLSRALEAPSLLVYGDGRVIQAVPHRADLYAVPHAHVIGRADATEVARFVGDAQASGLIDQGTDFGTPGVTDMPSTMVLLHGVGAASTVDLYAFSPSFNQQLPASQRRAREQLAQQIERARALAGGSSTDYEPDAVQVIELESRGSPPGPTWPGPDPSTFLHSSTDPLQRIGCGVVRGASAGPVFRAAVDNDGQVWAVAGRARTLAVTPVFPGQDGCRP